MASGRTENGTIQKSSYLTPIAAVRDFFESLTDLKGLSRSRDQEKQVDDDENVLVACEKVSDCGERVAKCLHHQMQQQNRASEMAHEIVGAFQRGVKKLVNLKGEVDDLKKVIKELNLADKDKQREQRDFSIPGSGSTPIPRAASYEDFRRHRDLMLSSGKKVESSAGGSSIRKAKSESDVAVVSLRKKVDVLTIDNGRLKEKEKNLVKKNIKLNKNVKALEKERDVAEDRLKIEQTQRDSIEKLRQRNKELEDQLRKLCESQVIRERQPLGKEEDDKGRDQPPASSSPRPTEPPEAAAV